MLCDCVLILDYVCIIIYQNKYSVPFLFCIYYDITLLLKYSMTSSLMTPKHNTTLSVNCVVLDSPLLLEERRWSTLTVTPTAVKLERTRATRHRRATVALPVCGAIHASKDISFSSSAAFEKKEICFYYFNNSKICFFFSFK